MPADGSSERQADDMTVHGPFENLTWFTRAQGTVGRCLSLNTTGRSLRELTCAPGEDAEREPPLLEWRLNVLCERLQIGLNDQGIADALMGDVSSADSLDGAAVLALFVERVAIAQATTSAETHPCAEGWVRAWMNRNGADLATDLVSARLAAWEDAIVWFDPAARLECAQHYDYIAELKLLLAPHGFQADNLDLFLEAVAPPLVETARCVITLTAFCIKSGIAPKILANISEQSTSGSTPISRALVAIFEDLPLELYPGPSRCALGHYAALVVPLVVERLEQLAGIAGEVDLDGVAPSGDAPTRTISSLCNSLPCLTLRARLVGAIYVLADIACKREANSAREAQSFVETVSCVHAMYGAAGEALIGLLKALRASTTGLGDACTPPSQTAPADADAMQRSLRSSQTMLEKAQDACAGARLETVRALMHVVAAHFAVPSMSAMRRLLIASDAHIAAVCVIDRLGLAVKCAQAEASGAKVAELAAASSSQERTPEANAAQPHIPLGSELQPPPVARRELPFDYATPGAPEVEPYAAQTTPLGLANVGNSCYTNSVLQALASSRNFPDLLRSIHGGGQVAWALRWFFRRHAGDPAVRGCQGTPASVLAAVVKSDPGMTRFGTGEQQDTHDLLLAVLNAILAREAADAATALSKAGGGEAAGAPGALAGPHAPAALDASAASSFARRPSFEEGLCGVLCAATRCLECDAISRNREAFTCISLTMPTPDTETAAPAADEPDVFAPATPFANDCAIVRGARPEPVGGVPAASYAPASVEGRLECFLCEEYVPAAQGGGYDCDNCTLRAKQLAELAARTDRTPAPRQAAMRSYVIERLPSMLTLQLRRFMASEGTMKKVKTHVSYPLVLSLRPFCAADSFRPRSISELELEQEQQQSREADGPPRQHVAGDASGAEAARSIEATSTTPEQRTDYALHSVIVHHGDTLERAHYTTYVRRGAANGAATLWYHVNDAEVTKTTEADVLGAEAYLLFYDRIASGPGA